MKIWGFGGCWQSLTRVWHLNVNLNMGTSLWNTHVPNFGCLSCLWRCKENPCPLSPDMELWRTLEVPDWGSESDSWIGYGHWSLTHPCFYFWLNILILKMQRTSMAFKSWLGAMEDAGDSWLKFGILILIWIWSLVFNTPNLQNLALCLDIEGA